MRHLGISVIDSAPAASLVRPDLLDEPGGANSVRFCLRSSLRQPCRRWHSVEKSGFAGRTALRARQVCKDSPLEGGVTSELVSGIRGSGPHFGILFPPLTRPRARARGQRRKSRRCGPICRRGELVLEMKCWKGRTSRRGGSFFAGGTEGSNPSSSSGESSTNLDIGDLAGAVVVAACPIASPTIASSTSFPPRCHRNQRHAADWASNLGSRSRCAFR